MGVLIASSCLMKSENPGKGLRAESADNSDGKVADGRVFDGKLALMGVFS